MMPVAWQQADLAENIRRLSQLPAYTPIFAVPFGTQIDWNEDALRVCSAMNVTMVTAGGGVNLSPRSAYDRIPSDGSNLPERLANAVIEDRGNKGLTVTLG